MTPFDRSQLHLRQIGDLSYSGWSQLRRCHLRAAFSLSSTTKTLDRGGILSAIGNARHKLVELVSKGRRDGLEAPQSGWVREQFDQLLTNERAALVAQWSPADVPPIRTWPDVALTRALVARRLGSPEGAQWPHLVYGQQEGHEAPAPALRHTEENPVPPKAGEAAIEVTLRDVARGLWGRIDRLENRGGVLVVVDFKSGVGMPSAQLADRHRLQMLFYAGLVNAAYGTWPRLELVPINGVPVSIGYEPADAGVVRAEALVEREALNTELATGEVVTAVRATTERCAWCPFQVVCPALRAQWAAIESVDGNPPPHHAVSLVAGVVEEVRHHHASTEVVIAQAEELTAPAGDVIVTRLPSGLTVSAGSVLAVSRVSPSASVRVLRASWDSILWPIALTV